MLQLSVNYNDDDNANGSDNANANANDNDNDNDNNNNNKEKGVNLQGHPGLQGRLDHQVLRDPLVLPDHWVFQVGTELGLFSSLALSAILLLVLLGHRDLLDHQGLLVPLVLPVHQDRRDPLVLQVHQGHLDLWGLLDRLVILAFSLVWWVLSFVLDVVWLVHLALPALPVLLALLDLQDPLVHQDHLALPDLREVLVSCLA